MKALRWAGHVAREEENRNTYVVVVVKPERRKCHGGPRLRWDDNLNMYLKK